MRGLPLTLVLTAILLLTIPVHGVTAHSGDYYGDEADDEHNDHEDHDYDEHENTGDDNHEGDDEEDDNDCRDHHHKQEDGRKADFKLHAHPHSLKVHRGENVSVTLSLKVKGDGEGCAYIFAPLNGTVQLTLSWDKRTPSNVSYSFQPTSIGSGESSILTFVAHLDSTIGKFPFHIQGALGDQTDSIRMLLKIKPDHKLHPPPPTHPDFSISADPIYLSTTQGESASSIVTVSSIQGFNSPVNLTLDWDDDDAPSGVTATFDPTTLSPTATSTLTLQTSTNSPTGIFEFHVTGTSWSIEHHSPAMYLNISSTQPPPPEQGDFRIESIPNATIRAGENVRFNVRLTPLNGFNQPVSLIVSPATLTGASIALTSQSATPPALIFLNINTTSTITRATYNFTITGTSGSLTHQVTARLTVLLAIVTPPVSEEFPWFWLAIAAILIIGVATAVALRIRRRPPASPTPSPTT